MEPVYGMHLGLVVNNIPDPENRNRIQVWIPYLSNTLYSSLNSKLKNINIKAPADLNLIDKNILITLQNVLPWAEYAAPVFGGSSGLYNAATASNPVPANGGANLPSTAITSGSTISPANNASPAQPITTAAMTLSGNKPSGNFSPTIYNASQLGKIVPQKNDNGQEEQYISASDLHQINLQAASQYLVGRPAPSDGAKYGLADANGSTQGYQPTAEQWANLMDRVAFHESHHDNGNNYIAINTTYFEKDFKNANPNDLQFYSSGLFSMTVGQYGLNTSNIYNPIDNANAAAQYMATLLNNNNMVIGGAAGGINSGLAGGFSTATQLRDGQSAIVSSGAITPTGSGTALVANVSRSAPSMIPSNIGSPGSPVGTFSRPNAGTKVWVFFLGGDIQRPVYFAQAPNPSDVAATVTIANPPKV